MSSRIHDQPGFLLHHRPFRDTSLILDVFSRDHGRLALVARGARGPRSKLKGALRPFMPLKLSWVLRADLGTLTGAEIDGRPIALSGDALLSGYYVNELILNFLHRHDAQPEIFAAYADTIGGLASAPAPAPVLRGFEMQLLALLGYALNLDHDAATGEPIESARHYQFRPDQGAVGVSRDAGARVYSGDVLSGIGAGRFAQPEVLAAAGRLLRDVITYHLGGKELKSRKVLVDLHRSRAKMTGRPPASSTRTAQTE